MSSDNESSLKLLIWQLFVKQSPKDDITELQNVAAHTCRWIISFSVGLQQNEVYLQPIRSLKSQTVWKQKLFSSSLLTLPVQERFSAYTLIR